MAVNKIELKRSAVPGRVPTTSSLDLGELAINTYDGKVFFKQSGSITTIVELATTSGSAASSSFAISASYALSSSYAYQATNADTSSFAGNYTLTSSFNGFATASNANTASINSYTSSLNAKTGSFATTGSNQFNGNQTITGSLIQGLGNIATGENSHAEGDGTQAIGNFSHAEGLGTIAYGGRSHAEGQDTIASGSYSHAEGYGTIALADHQHVQGKYNITSSVPAAFIVGNGTDDGNRSNLIHAAGNVVEITGSLIVNGSITGSIFGTASYANNADLLDGLNSTQFTQTGSFRFL